MLRENATYSSITLCHQIMAQCFPAYHIFQCTCYKLGLYTIAMAMLFQKKIVYIKKNIFWAISL